VPGAASQKIHFKTGLRRASLRTELVEHACVLNGYCGRNTGLPEIALRRYSDVSKYSPSPILAMSKSHSHCTRKKAGGMLGDPHATARVAALVEACAHAIYNQKIPQ